MLQVSFTETKRTVNTDGHTVTTTVEGRKPLTVPTKWGMFTSAGNKRLTDIATEAMGRITALVIADKTSADNVTKVLVTMLYKWYRMSDSKSYREAADTAVRECIGDFHDKLFEAATGQTTWDEWEHNRDAAYERHSKFWDNKAKARKGK